MSGTDAELSTAEPSTADAPTGVWVDVVAFDRLTPGRGVAALVRGQQIALFRVDEEVYAIDNLDPFSGAHVMSRGIVGDRGGIPKVASPMFKQSFDLRNGQCLDDDSIHVRNFPVQIVNHQVQVLVP
jgi:nitrite reductase (NADH) small subunit